MRGGVNCLQEYRQHIVGFLVLAGCLRSEAEKRVVVGGFGGLVSKRCSGGYSRAGVIQKGDRGRVVQGGEAGAGGCPSECGKVQLGDRPKGQIGPPVRPGTKHSGRLAHAVKTSGRKAIPTGREYEMGQNGTLG